MDKLKLIEAILGSQCGESSNSDSPFEKGEKLFIRTVTHYLTGKVTRQVGKFLFLDDAAWIADTGRFHDALRTGKLHEVEPALSTVRLNTECIVDVYEWKHELPKTQI